ncbi:MAG: type II secretion system F family protein [Pseudohongiellaceae bacterium]
MAHFQYSGRDSSGGRVSGTIDATTADEVAAELFGQNVTPIDIKQVARKQAKSRKPKASENATTIENINAFLAKKRVETDDLIMFARQMHSLTKAGLPLDRAMKGLEASLINPLFKSVLQEVIDGLENGQSLASAMGRHPRIFNELFLSLIHVGENTGRLDLAFKEIGRYLELEKNTRKQVKSATRYPIFVMSAMVAALAVITVFVIPVFSQTFERLGAELPWQTVLLINTSDFVVNYWPILLSAAVGGFFWFRYWIRTEKGRLSWDQRKMRLPLAGPVFEKVALARFSRTLAMVLKAGLPIVQGLNVVSGAVGNAYVARNVNKMRENVERGEGLHRTAVNSKMFTPLVLQMISVGEETGAVDELLSEVAEFYDAEVEYDLKQMSDAIEPILISFIAGLVLILALGVFLPIWDLNTAVQ